MTWYAGEDVAERTGVEPSYVIRLVELGILVPEQPDRFSSDRSGFAQVYEASLDGIVPPRPPG